MTYATLQSQSQPPNLASEIYVPSGTDEDEWLRNEAIRRGVEPDELDGATLEEELREYGVIS